MENAAKALLIAGEVFIGIILLTILAVTFRNVSTINENYQETIDQRKTTAFNLEYQVYTTSDDKKLAPEEVVSLANRVINWNKSNEDKTVKIQLNINLTNGEKIEIMDKVKYTKTTGTIEKELFDEKEFLTEYKLKGNPLDSNNEYKFNCQMTFGGENGRVDTILVSIIE